MFKVWFPCPETRQWPTWAWLLPSDLLPWGWTRNTVPTPAWGGSHSLWTQVGARALGHHGQLPDCSVLKDKLVLYPGCLPATSTKGGDPPCAGSGPCTRQSWGGRCPSRPTGCPKSMPLRWTDIPSGQGITPPVGSCVQCGRRECDHTEGPHFRNAEMIVEGSGEVMARRSVFVCTVPTDTFIWPENEILFTCSCTLWKHLAFVVALSEAQ